MFSDIPIKYFNGTHRVKEPKETIKNYEDKLRVAGITRLTEITDLDRVGIPVFSAIAMAIGPMATTLPTAVPVAVAIKGS